jgi:tRNA A37 threonylcarbamoyladenosine dehydratase
VRQFSSRNPPFAAKSWLRGFFLGLAAFGIVHVYDKCYNKSYKEKLSTAAARGWRSLVSLTRAGVHMRQFSRTELIVGRQGLEKLRASKIAVFGIGGVGSFAAEALARAGVGSLTLVDKDVIDETNINRQLHATFLTLGRPKVEAMKERILSINPEAEVAALQEVYSPATAERLFPSCADYIIDAIDAVAGKVDLAQRAWQNNIPIVSSMGAGNKLDPSRFALADIFSTSVDPLARVMRKKLRKAGVPALKVVFSEEEPRRPQREGGGGRGFPPGSISFVPSVAGLMLAGEVVRCILSEL